MTVLKDTPSEKLSPLARIVLGQSAPTEPNEVNDLKFFDETLNESQKAAVRFSLSAPELALIHGPPGVTNSPPLLTVSRQEKPTL